MAKVRVIASTIRYGSNGFKHAGDEFNLPDESAKEKEALGLVRIIPSLTKNLPPAEIKEEKSVKETKELKEDIKTK